MKLGRSESESSTEKILEWSLNDKELARGSRGSVFWVMVTASWGYCELVEQILENHRSWWFYFKLS